MDAATIRRRLKDATGSVEALAEKREEGGGRVSDDWLDKLGRFLLALPTIGYLVFGTLIISLFIWIILFG